MYEWFAGKLVSTLTNNGLGALLKPYVIRQEGQANVEIKRLECLTAAQTHVDQQKILNGELIFTEAGKLESAPGWKKTDTVIERSIVEELEHERTERRAANLLGVISKAAEAGKNAESSPKSDAAVDPDWFTRWREGAENVSNDQLQELWGKLLSGEIIEPGSFSLRTIDFIKNLSMAEAALIHRFCGFVIDDRLVARGNDENIITKFFGGESPIREIERLGIADGLLGMGLQIEVSDSNLKLPTTMKCGDAIFKVEKTEKTPDKFTFHIGELTSIGKEIWKLSEYKCPDGYFEVATSDFLKADCKATEYRRQPDGQFIEVKCLEPN
jgi:Protein of unknown function (DUF2806)